MDSKTVSTEIRRLVRPLLKSAGFTTFVARNAWRRREGIIEVVNFQSFSPSLAEGLRCTTFSVGINLGIYFLAVHDAPWISRYPVAPRPDQPPEYTCQARNHLKKRLRQREFPRRDIWFVPETGEGLERIIEDARSVIELDGLPWFEEFGELRSVLRHFLTPRTHSGEEFVAPLGTLGAARDGSPIALALGDVDAARRLWQAVRDEPYYAKMRDVQQEAEFCLATLNPGTD